MSGGSFDYLCLYEPDVTERVEDMERMAAALREYKTPEANVAAQITEGFIRQLREFQAYIDRHIADIAPVWKAVEWNHSCDWSREQVLETLSEWMKGTAHA